MLVIRLARGGAKKRPFYHVVVAEKSSPRDGRFVERIGFCNPMAAGQAEPLRIDLARFEHWTGIGAHPSETVARLARKQRRILSGEESEKPETKTAAKAQKSA
ncbi:MAG: 30S ribosomal protein S16, partial [Betaproteobacteria bacterium]|nr:30S ribosomal protein S16 [Betaproteobacteria bacterium]